MLLELNLLIQNRSQKKYNFSLIKNAIIKTLKLHKMFGKIEIGILIVGQKYIREINKKYRQIDQATDVLSFPQINFIKSPHINLGDIIICPVIAKKYHENIIQLTIHALKHLLGIHHK